MLQNSAFFKALCDLFILLAFPEKDDEYSLACFKVASGQQCFCGMW